MTELDKIIDTLFLEMIKSWDKISNIDSGIITFDNGITISAHKKNPKNEKNRENTPLKLDKSTFSLSFFYTCLSFSDINPDSDKILFSIGTPYRQYQVPEHDRHAYVEVLDTLDESIRKFEEKKLEEYIKYFSTK